MFCFEGFSGCFQFSPEASLTQRNLILQYFADPMVPNLGADIFSPKIRGMDCQGFCRPTTQVISARRPNRSCCQQTTCREGSLHYTGASQLQSHVDHWERKTLAPSGRIGHFQTFPANALHHQALASKVMAMLSHDPSSGILRNILSAVLKSAQVKG